MPRPRALLHSGAVVVSLALSMAALLSHGAWAAKKSRKEPKPAPSALPSPAPSPAPSGAAEGVTLLLDPAGRKIDGLTWLTGAEVPLSLQIEGLTGEVEFTYFREDWGLLFANKALKPVEDNKTYRLGIPITEAEQRLTLVAVGPHGKVEKTDFRLLAPDVEAMKKDPRRFLPLRASRFTVGMAFTAINYSASRVPAFWSTALTVKAEFRQKIFSWPLEAFLSSYFTAFPLTTAGGGNAIRYLGINARLGLPLKLLKQPWSLSLFGGLYYTTTFVKDDQFGFKNLMGPQLYPVIRRRIGLNRAVSGYFKFSPISNGFSLLDLASNEIALGTAYSWPAAAGNPVSLTLDASRLRLDFQGVQVNNFTLSLGISYGF